MTYTYDDRNNITSVTNQDGNTTTYHYDGNLLKRITPPAEGETTYEYWPGNLKGLVKTYTDSLQNTFQYEYANGFLTLTTNPLGEKTAVEWAAGRPHIVDVRSAVGTSIRRTTIDYWAPGWMKRRAIQFAGQSDADAFATAYEYDAVGNIKTLNDAVGNVFTYEYDDNNYLQRMNYPAFKGQTRHTDYQYTRIDQLSKTTYSPQVSNSFTWNVVNEMLTLRDGNSENYRYGRAMKNPAAQAPYNWEEITTFPTLTGDPSIYTESITTDPSGRVIANRDRAEQVTDISYSSEQNSPGSTYDTITKVTLPPAKTGDPRLSVEFRFNPANRIKKLTNTAQKSTTWTYSTEHDPTTNSNLLVATITDPANRQRVIKYDALGRLAYDRQGSTDSGIILQYAYDAIGRAVRVKQQKNADTTVDTTFTYTFDAPTKTLAVAIGSPGAPATHTQYYDGADNMVRDTNALGKATVLTYTPWGALATYTNRRGKVFTYGFDLAGRLVTTTIPDGAGTVTQTLDGNGNRSQTQRTGGSPIVRTFDQWNRLLSRIDVSNRLVSYTYWPTNPLRKLTYPDTTKSINYQIDNLSRLTKVTDWGARATSYDYWPSGMLQKATYWNGTLAFYDYDDADNLTGIVHSRSSILIAKETVVLDGTGNPATGQSVLPIAATLSAASATFTFNAVNEIETWNGQPASYDDDGNLLTLLGRIQPHAATYDALNRLTALGTDVYSYDDDGFRSGATIGGSERAFVHDVASWQSPQVERADPYRAVVEYGPTASPYGIAVGAPRYGTAHEAVGAAEATDRLIEIRDGDGRVTSRFIHGSLGLVGLENATGDGYVAHTNSVGNTLALTDASGAIRDRYAYDAFGALVGQYGPSSQPFRYNGREGVFDDGNGVLYMRGRSYSPDSQAFLQRDTLIGDLQFPQTLNGYSFVAGNPLRKNDPLGLALIVGGAVLLGLGLALFALSRLIPPPVVPPVPSTTPPPSTSPPLSPSTPPGFTQQGTNTYVRGNQTLTYRGRVPRTADYDYIDMQEFSSTRSVSNNGIKYD